MKAILVDFHAWPFDMMELCALPPGELDVQIRLRCDQEAYLKLMQFFVQAGFQRQGQPMPVPKALPEGEPALPAKIEPKALRAKKETR